MSVTNGVETLPQISKEIIVHDFINALKGKLDDEIIQTANKQIQTVMTSYPAVCRIINTGIYSEIQVAITNGKTFKGNSGIYYPNGNGVVQGQVNTNDIDLLYANTVSMMINITPVYMGISFFDKDSNLLGMFIGSAVATIVGVGGGNGTWS
jgi:hypothetical protein